MKRLYSHILIPLLILVITATTLVFTGSKPASAVFGVGDVTATIETVSIPQMFFNSVVKGVEAAGYTVLRKAMRQGLSNLTKDFMNRLVQGGKGKTPAFQTEPWDQFWDQAGDEAAGAALEGFVQGFQNEYEAQSKKAAAVKNLTAAETAKLQPQYEAAAKLSTDAEICKNDPNKGPTNQECIDKQAAWVKANGDLAKNESNSFVYQQQVITAKRKPLEKQLSDLQVAYNECVKREQQANPSVVANTVCTAERTALSNKQTEVNNIQTELNTALNAADKATAEELKKIDRAANKKDADLIAGNTGALSAASKTLIDIVCKPTPDIALGIFLPLGDRIEQNKRTALCPYSKIKENWQEIYNNTGTQLNDISLGNWRTIAGLVNPNTSDLGAAYSVSIAGLSVSDAAQALGVTQYLDTSTAGGLKAATEFNGKKTSPVSASIARLQSTIEAGVQEDTRLLSTGHLLADLVVTGLGTIINTTFEILQEGLTKKTAAVRQPKQKNGIAALSRFAGGAGTGVLYNPTADPNAGSESYAEARLVAFSQLDLSASQDWPVLANLNNKTCPDTQNIPGGTKGADPDACVMDDKFVEAVKERITVQEALDRNGGLLNKNGIFGFDIDNAEVKDIASWEGNFPYRSLVILRKYRVIPVSWELAALFIKENPVEARSRCGGSCTLQDMINNFPDKTSPFYQMVDPNWVLKIPPGKCFLKGFGPEILEFTSVTVCNPPNSANCHVEQVPYRRPDTCVDYRTCLTEDAEKEGKCANDQSYGYCLQEQKVIRFQGEVCNKTFNGCEVFQDPQTKQSVPYLKLSLEKNADLGNGKCTPDNAGCRWLSAKKQFQDADAPNADKFALNADKQAKILVDSTTKTQQEWSSATTDRVYLASKAGKCQPEAEGCREVSGVPGMQYLRLPPASYECDKDGIDPYGNLVPWYKRAECKQFTGVCRQEYVGCEKYTPTSDTFSVTGISPDDSATPVSSNTTTYQYRCPAQCAGIKNFTAEKTLFDTVQPTAENFSADTAAKCSISDVGCEVLTNVTVAAAGGVGIEYYTFLQQCVQLKADEVPAKQVFLSFVGTEQAGGQPVKYYVVGTTVAEGKGSGDWVDTKANDWNPKCADPDKPCDCEVADVNKNMNDPRIGTILCREFINSEGKSFYRYTDNLIYYATDCNPFRRTLEGDAATSELYSQSLSKQCSSPAAVNCRKYSAPTAGNIRVVSYDNFEDGDVSGWSMDTGSEDLMENKVTSIGEILGDHSLKIQKKSTYTGDLANAQATKKIDFRKGSTFDIAFNIKGANGYVLKAFIGAITGANTETISIGSDKTLNGNWQRIQYSVDKNVLKDKTFDSTELRIIVGATNVSDFTIDDIVVKETDGIEYVVKDSWQKDGMCFVGAGNPPEPDFTQIAYPGCSLYTDRQGGQHAIRSFERICPLEMAGCVRVDVNKGESAKEWTFDSGIMGWGVVLDRGTIEYVQVEGALKGTSTDVRGQFGNQAWFLPQIAIAATKNLPYELKLDIKGMPTDASATLYINGSLVGTPVGVGSVNAWKPIEISFIPNVDIQTIGILLKSASTFTVYLDNVQFAPQGTRKYIIPDPSKQCSAQDNKCTAYGSPKLLTKTDGSEGVKTIKNAAQDATRNEWMEKEDWNIVYFKVTPEEAAVAQVQFANGVTSGYDTGICRSATYSGTTMTDPGDLGCREYVAGSTGISAFFRDPGNSVCQSPKTGQSKGFYYTCTDNETIVCRTNADCPVKNDQPGTCNTQNEISANCPTLPPADSNTTSFVQSCPASEGGCRKIIDPECVESTSKLRTDYGRSDANNGIPCTREYYFTGALDKKGSDYKGQVDVEKGYLLFDDEGRREFKYTIVTSQHCGTLNADGTVARANPDTACTRNSDCTTTGQTCSYLKTDDTSGTVSLPQDDPVFSQTPPTYCACDVSPFREDDCAASNKATELDPPVCYNRYTQNVANTGPLLRKYKKVRVDRVYDSNSFYSQGQPTNLNISTASNCPVNASCDANTLIKIKQDRTCKTWLACTSYEKIGDRTVCTQQTACDKGSSTACENTISDPVAKPQIARTLFGGVCSNNKSLACTQANQSTVCGTGNTCLYEGGILNSLTGIARPDYKFPNSTWVSSGGYDSGFNLWSQEIIQGTESLFYSKLTNAQTPAFSAINSCRLYPKQDAPVTGARLVDSCVADEGSAGIYGFCLEPYPAFKSEFEVSGRADKKTCTNDPGKQCPNGNSDCKINDEQGICVYRYYNNYCLNWFPVDRVNGQRNITAVNDPTNYSWFGTSSVPESIYYCLREESTSTVKAVGSYPYCEFGFTDNTQTACSPKDPTPRPDISARNVNLSIFEHGLCGDKVYYRIQGSSKDTQCEEAEQMQRISPNVLLLFARGQDYTFEVPANDREDDVYDSDFHSFDLGGKIFGTPDSDGSGGVPAYEPVSYDWWNYNSDPFAGGVNPFDAPCPGNTARVERNKINHDNIAYAGTLDEFKQQVALDLVDVDPRKFIAIRPRFGSDRKLRAWQYRVCDASIDSSVTSTRTLGYATLVIHQRDQTYQPPALQTVNVSRNYTDTVCTDIVKVAQKPGDQGNVQAVSRGPIFTGNLPIDGVSAEVVLEHKRASSCVPDVTPPAGTESSVTSLCSGDDPGFDTRVAPNNAKFAGVNVISGTAAINDSEFAKIRIQSPFEKVYGYWALSGAAYGESNAFLDKFWTDSQSGNVQHGSDTYKSSDNYPRIVSAYSEDPNKSFKEDRFSANVVGKNQVFISFYTHTPKSEQLPIKLLQIDWDDHGSPPNQPIYSTQDGIGNRTKEHPSGPEDPFTGYSFGHTYVPELNPDGVVGRTICITIRDNFNASRTACGKFGRTSAGKIDVESWTAPPQYQTPIYSAPVIPKPSPAGGRKGAGNNVSG